MIHVSLMLTNMFLACSTENNLTSKVTIPDVVGPGSVKGRVCDPTGRTWLADALAYVNVLDDNGVIYDTKKAFTDLDGYFEIDDLPGDRTYTIYVTWGPEILRQEEVYVGNGESVELEEPSCFDPLSLDVAVVTGDYDDFSKVLTDMGFVNFKEINGTDQTELVDFLSNADNLNKYDIIFMDGGFVEQGVIYDADTANTTPATVMSNIRAYVEAGGAIYASDWAYDVVEVGWPDRIDFVGADEIPDDAQKGDYELVKKAAVSDAALAEYLGEQYMEIEYDLPVWPPMESVASTVSVHVTGTIPYSDGLSDYTLANVPLLASFNSGDGKVVFSTFRVVRNGGGDMLKSLQYMMYNL